MNAERKFLFACLIFALVIYAIHAFGLFDLLTDLPHLQTLIRQSGLFGLKRAKLFKIDMEFFQDKPEARIWKLFKIKQRH